jgi:hypothetical protein
MTTTEPAQRSGRLHRTTATWACAALAAAAVSGAVPAQAAAVARAPGHARATPARAAAATPRGREWAAFGYYPPKNELVLFGGRRPGTVFGDTWTRIGSTWTQAHPATSPSARTGAAMIYDPASSQLLLFGGGATTGTGFSNQTWTWNGTTWTLLHPSTSPPAREDTELVYDGATKTVLLFAGWHGAYWDDTWSWNGTTWTQLSPATSPSGRDSDALVYDAAAKQVILFGGFRGAGYTPGDTWTWNGTTWTQLSPPASPGVDVFAWQASYDPASGQVVLFGGDEGGGTFGSNTWTWTGTTWSQLSPATVPEVRAFGTMTYDSADQHVVLFAGSENALKTFPTDIWSWTGTTWTPGS